MFLGKDQQAEPKPRVVLPLDQCYLTKSPVCFSPGDNENGIELHGPPAFSPPTRTALGISFVLSLATKLLILHYRWKLEATSASQSVFCFCPLPVLSACKQNTTELSNSSNISLSHARHGKQEVSRQYQYTLFKRKAI